LNFVVGNTVGNESRVGTTSELGRLRSSGTFNVPAGDGPYGRSRTRPFPQVPDHHP
jgi:hypothetical protein